MKEMDNCGIQPFPEKSNNKGNTTPTFNITARGNIEVFNVSISQITSVKRGTR